MVKGTFEMDTKPGERLRVEVQQTGTGWKWKCGNWEGQEHSVELIPAVVMACYEKANAPVEEDTMNFVGHERRPDLDEAVKNAVEQERAEWRATLRACLASDSPNYKIESVDQLVGLRLAVIDQSTTVYHVHKPVTLAFQRETCFGTSGPIQHLTDDERKIIETFRTDARTVGSGGSLAPHILALLDRAYPKKRWSPRPLAEAGIEFASPAVEQQVAEKWHEEVKFLRNSNGHFWTREGRDLAYKVLYGGTLPPESTSPLYCGHANETARDGCDCGEYCYCRVVGTCGTRLK
jgi:hypothetical protein